jgi:WD40 repeat protein
LTVRTKYSKDQLKYKSIKYFKNLKIRTGTIYSIIKINNEEIAVASGKEILIINDIKAAEQKGILDFYPSLKGHTKNILCLALLSENLLASGSEDKTIKIWDISNQKLIKTISKNYKRIDSLLEYERNILIAGTYNIIRVINIDTKEELLTLIGHEKTVCSIIKINENKLASSSYDNLIKIWNMDNKACEFTLYGHDSPVFCILLLKDGRLVSGSGSRDKSINIWNLSKKKCEFTLVGHKREVRDIKQLSNNFIITASTDKTIKLWNLFHKSCIQTLNSHFDVIFCLCMIDKNIFCSAGREEDIFLWKY